MSKSRALISLNFLVFLVLFFFASSAFAASVPLLINYQGILTDRAGRRRSGTFYIRFNIWNNPTSTNPIYKVWPEGDGDEHSNVVVRNGVLSMFIGGGSDLIDPAALAHDDAYASDDRYLQIEVKHAGVYEILWPRSKITSVGYTLNAEQVKGPDNYFPSSGNVGIGTTEPTAALKVIGPAEVGHPDNLATGPNSIAMGYQTTASGEASTAMGYQTTAGPGDYSTAMGFGTKATGLYSTAMGYQTTASGEASTTMGYQTTAGPGNYSTAMGFGTKAIGLYSTAMGHNATANGEHSIAIGNNASTTIAAPHSRSFGRSASAQWMDSTAIGAGATASGGYSISMGADTVTDGGYSIAMGAGAVAAGHYSVALGRLVSTEGRNSEDRYSVVMGRKATDNSYGGCFVFADSTDAAYYAATAVNQFRIRASGEVWHGSTQKWDIAEEMIVYKSDNIQEGELVSLSGNDILGKTKGAYDDNLVGVISSKRTTTLHLETLEELEDDSLEKKYVTLVGRVYVKINNQNGNIKIGDPITASNTPGVGMKTDKPCKVIGYAMENAAFGGESESEILVFANLGYYIPGSVYKTLNTLEQRIEALEGKK